jgi:hypothetical protein
MKETLAKVQEIQSSRILKFQFWLVRFGDKGKGKQQKKLILIWIFLSLEGIYIQTLKVESMRPAGLISCV